jgi:hypothetical protein
MRKAKSDIADPWPAEGLPFDPARIAPKLWADYDVARAAARDIGPLIFFAGPGTSGSSLTPDEQRRLARRDQTKAALDARLRAYLKEDGRELWARHGSPGAPPERVLAAIEDLKFDHERRTAKVKTLTLYGLREQTTRAPTVPAGTPGRPTAAHLVDSEAERRINSGEVVPREGGLTEFSKNLATWWGDCRRENPELPLLKPKTIANRTRELWNSKLRVPAQKPRPKR